MTREDKHNQGFVSVHAPCFYCVHLIDVGEQRTSTNWTCKAYPEGIPHGIWSRSYKHDEVIFNQKGSYVYKSEVYKDDDGNDVVRAFDGTMVVT